MADWLSIKAEYISTGISTRALAEKHGISYSSLDKRSRKEHWSADRKEQCGKVAEKVRQKVAAVVAAKEVDRLTRILALGDTLLAKAERAAQELDQHLVTNKHRTRSITYGDPNAFGKPTKEVIEDVENIAIVDAPIDRMGVKQLASALKDLRDIAATPRADEQSLSKLADMMNRLDAESKEVAPDVVPER